MLSETPRTLCGFVFCGTLLTPLLSPSSNDTFHQTCISNDDEPPDPRWKIGEGGGIARGGVIVVGAINVSVGSWMPILQLNRYVL
jgi:hypothetical protein